MAKRLDDALPHGCDECVAADEVLAIVEQAREDGTAVLLSTHHIEEAARVCDRVALLLEGRLAALDTVEGMCAEHDRDDLREVVLKLARNHRSTLGQPVDRPSEP